MLVDNVKLTVIAGSGGNGILHFLRNSQTARGGPDGGNGGTGGSIYIQGSNNINDLREFRFKKQIKAENGDHGQRRRMSGKNASDMTVLVPIGTSITNLKTDEVIEITDTTKPILIAKGGRGGKGNHAFKTATNRSPIEHELGTPGEIKELFLELRLIADIGLIGLPNAGKSHLLAKLTRATPTIAAYPFTTLNPNIGMLEKYAIADIPGLIEGASGGKGLGIDFLKHIEKTKILLHCIDLTNDNPQKSYQTVIQELEKFNPLLITKPQYILLTKSDLVDKKTVDKVKKMFEKSDKTVFISSVYDEKSIEDLKKMILNLLK